MYRCCEWNHDFRLIAPEIGARTKHNSSLPPLASGRGSKAYVPVGGNDGRIGPNR